jgi:single-stranded DNA-binding protein
MIAVAKTILLGSAYNKKMIQTLSEKPMLTFTLRTWRPTKGGDKVCFFDVVAYSGAATVLGEHLYDGKIIYLECTTDQFKDQTGVSKVQFIVNEFSFIGNKDDVQNN